VIDGSLAPSVSTLGTGLGLAHRGLGRRHPDPLGLEGTGNISWVLRGGWIMAWCCAKLLGWMGEQKNRQMNGQVHGEIAGRMDGWMDAWVDGWMDGWMDALMIGWME